MPTETAQSIELLTIAEVAELMRVSVSAVRRLQQGRHLPFLKIGGSIRFAKDDIVSYRIGKRIYRPCRFGRAGVAVHSDVAEVPTEAGLEKLSRVLVQRPAR